MCLPALAAIPAVIGAASTAAGTAAGAGTFLGLAASTWGTIGAVSGLASTALTAAGAIQQGREQRQTHEYNAKVADMQATDARRRGSRAEGEQRTRYRQFQGRQRALMGASGSVVDEGSSADVLRETAIFGERDAQQLRLNAQRQAWGYNTQADLSRYQGRQAQSSSYARAGASLLSGTANFFTPSPWWESLRRPQQAAAAYDPYEEDYF